MASVLFVKKVETPNSKAWQEDIPVPYLAKSFVIPRHPFRLICSGQTGTGKTNSLAWILTRKLMYLKWFDEIHIICPSVSDSNYSVLDEIYEDSEITELKKYDSLDEKTLKSLHEIFTSARAEAKEMKHETKRRLIILDDVISDANVHRKEIKDLFFSGRHASLSVIVTSQSYMAVPRNLRLNASNLFLFSLLSNESEISRVVEEQRRGWLTKRQFTNVIMNSMIPTAELQKPFLHINLQSPDEFTCYRKGFAEVYDFDALRPVENTD